MAVVVRSSRRKAVVTGICCAAFVAGGLFMVLRLDSFTEVLVGMFSIFFFGVGGAFAIPRSYRRKVLLTLDELGLRMPDGGFLSWENIQSIGICTHRHSGRCAAVRIKSYKAYIETFTMAKRKQLIKRLAVVRGVSIATAAL